MRRILKQQALKVTRLLEQAQEKIQIQLKTGKAEEALNLLKECQDAAIHLGETIEQEEGEGYTTISLLEEYCEYIYQIYKQTLENTLVGKGNGIWKILRKCLIQIENSIKTDIRTHIEILFLPYKAAMWDSLESIWKAADIDPDCRAYVVPIPYYNRLTDGKLGQLHNEKDLYPAEVPVMDWQEYDLEKRHPDIIFIHSPYDSGNYVTTIHPDFYSSRLKENTDLLVYVPYYITLGVLPDDFCVTLGSLNADLVIVQSERVRQNYEKAFRKFEKEKNCQGMWGDVSKKFLALGSPKFDKVIRSKREDFQLPEKWKYLIDVANGGKNIIFYNTSINGILRGNKKYLGKLRSVLQIFRSRNDTVLWWRPHPLSEATVSSMCPTLLKEYQQIITDYQAEGWGIYDDTPNLHRAIAWSDAYYGDQSSVAALFQAAGKPVLLQSIEDSPLVFENFIQADGNFWFTTFNMNGLFRLSPKTWKADFMGCFPAEKDWRRLFYSITHYKNLLIFAPFCAEQISLYRMDTSEFISIPVQEPEKLAGWKAATPADGAEGLDIPYSNNRKFTVCAAYNGYAFLFPCTYPAVVKINLETYETEYLCGPVAFLREIIKHPQSYYFREGSQQGNIVRLWYVAANAFVEFDMDTCQFKIRGLVNDNEMYIETVCNNTGYWLFPKEPGKKAKRISKDFQESIPIDLSVGGISENLPYLHAIDVGDFIYAFPATAKHVVRIIKSENRAETFSVLDSESALTRPGPATRWQFFTAEKFGHIIYAYDAFSQKLLSYDPVTGDAKRESIRGNQEIHADTESLLTVWEMFYGHITQVQKLAAREGPRKSLNIFLELLSKKKPAFLETYCKAQKKFTENGEFPSAGDSGYSIYKHTKKYLLEKQGGIL